MSANVGFLLGLVSVGYRETPSKMPTSAVRQSASAIQKVVRQSKTLPLSAPAGTPGGVSSMFSVAETRAVLLVRTRCSRQGAAKIQVSWPRT